MATNNLKTLLQQKNIAWSQVANYLKSQNANNETVASMYSIFSTIDKTTDKELSNQEQKDAYKELNDIDTSQDGIITKEEIEAASDDNLFKSFDTDLINKFLDTINNIKSQEQNKFEEFKYDNENNLITYPLEGETFRKTAERLGFEYGSPEYNEFVMANSDANKRHWFKVGEQVKIPQSLQDKINQENLVNEEAGKAAVENFAKTKSSTKQTVTKQTSQTKQQTQKSTNSTNYPEQIKAKLKELDKNGDKYEVLKNSSNGFIIKVTDGKYMKKCAIGEILMEYDSAGNLKTYTQKYNNGQITEVNYTKEGKKKVEKAKPVPQKYQDFATKLQKEKGGNVRVEFDNKTNKYVLIQTNTKDTNIKERRIVVDEKSWQEKTSTLKTLKQAATNALHTYSLSSILSPINSTKKAFDAAARNFNFKATLQDHFLSETTTYSDGKVVQSTYQKGKIKSSKTVHEGTTQQTKPTTPLDAVNSVTAVENREKFHTATKISFKMPENAPQNAKTFANALIKNKERLMKELGIDNDTYNMLAQTAMGIAKQETNFGEKTYRQNFKDLARIPSDTIAVAQYTLDLENTSKVMGNWSHGITQLKYTLQVKDDWVKRKMESLGITNEMQLNNIETSAIATMVVLAKMNKEIDAPSYQAGIKTAQGMSVEYEGWEMGKDGIAVKTNNTKAWKNEITRQDVLCAFWNGAERANVKNGTFKPQGVQYIRNVKKYMKEYELQETEQARKEAIYKDEETRAFTNVTNNGDIGGVVFLPAIYTDKNKHMNNVTEIRQLQQALTKKGIDPNLKNQLISALQNGELGFDFGLRNAEIEALTEPDIKLLLTHLNKLKTNINSNNSINTEDGINSSEATLLRSKYAKAVADAEKDFRKEYLNNHSKVYSTSATNEKILRETSTSTRTGNYVGVNGQRRGFQHEKSKGVNLKTTNGQVNAQSAVLANSAQNIVDKNPNNVSGQCLTGVKEAMAAAGIDVSEMVKYGSVPKYVKNWFAAHPEMFTPVEYVSTGDNTARVINYSDISSLPAGYIVIFEPENGANYDEQVGHIAITNGNGQGYADATDNLEWGTYSNNKAESGKGEHGKFIVYKLSNNWEVTQDGKLKLKR